MTNAIQTGVLMNTEFPSAPARHRKGEFGGGPQTLRVASDHGRRLLQRRHVLQAHLGGVAKRRTHRAGGQRRCRRRALGIPALGGLRLAAHILKGVYRVFAAQRTSSNQKRSPEHLERLSDAVRMQRQAPMQVPVKCSMHPLHKTLTLCWGRQN